MNVSPLNRHREQVHLILITDLDFVLGSPFDDKKIYAVLKYAIVVKKTSKYYEGKKRLIYLKHRPG